METKTSQIPKLLNQKQVAELIGFSEAWLERCRWQGGGIPFIKLGGRSVRYFESDVIEFINSHGKRTSTSSCA